MQIPSTFIFYAAVFIGMFGTLVGCGGGSVDSVKNTPIPLQIPIVEPEQGAKMSFSDYSQFANLNFRHAYTPSTQMTMPMMYSGGVAVADYDNDNDLDIYLIAGNDGTNHLYQNQNDGSYIEVASEAGVAVSGIKSAGPSFADLDGDGWLELFIGAVDGETVYLFKNNRDGTFSDITSSSGLNFQAPNSISTSFGDIDQDGDLDMLISHWGNELAADKSLEIVWRNDSTSDAILFADVSTEWGMTEAYAQQIAKNTEQNKVSDSSFVPSLSDIDRDGDLDLLLVSDFGYSKVLINQNGQRFENITSSEITDQFGMGSSVGDYDNDGDMDWYVTSIHEKATDSQSKNPSQGYRGNHLYRNDGQGNFTNQGSALNIADGGWAWASCFADFNNDGLTDIFHVNGWGQDGLDFAHYIDDKSRLYIQQSDGSFVESALAMGINDSRQGRGIACDDLDGDGDIDIVISNNQDMARFYRNDLSAGHHYLVIKLVGQGANTQGIGSLLQIESLDQKMQTKEISASNNFISSNAAQAHFGFGISDSNVKVTITWPDGSQEIYNNIQLDQTITFEQQ